MEKFSYLIKIYHMVIELMKKQVLVGLLIVDLKIFLLLIMIKNK